MKRLAKMRLGTLLAVLALLIPAAPANADDDYMVELTIDDDLNIREIMNVTIPDDSFKLMGNFDFCEQLESLAKVRMADAPGISNPKLGNCEQHENNISFEITGKVKEDFTSGEGWKVTDEEIVYSLPREVGMFSGLIDSTEGGVKITFPGKIKNVEPNIGTISGNSWSIDNANNIDSQVTITAERHGSSLGSILGIAIPLVLIIAAVLVAVVVIRNRKNKQDSNQSMPGYGAYPPPPVPGNPAVPQAPDRLQSAPNMPEAEAAERGSVGITTSLPPMPGVSLPRSGQPPISEAHSPLPNPGDRSGFEPAGSADVGIPAGQPFTPEVPQPSMSKDLGMPGEQPHLPGSPQMSAEQSPNNEAVEAPSEYPHRAQDEGLPENQPPTLGTAGMFPEQPPVTGAAQPPTPAVSPQNGYPPQYGYFPAQPAMPGCPAQPPMPGYPASAAPGIQEAAPYMPGGKPAAPGASGIPAGQPPMPGSATSPISGAPSQGGYPPGYGYFPATPVTPGNPVQPPMPGYPASGAPGMPGAAPYPPNVPPQAQPGAPIPGGYYPYPYPYPPANPQNSVGGQPLTPKQGYGAPTPGFPPPETPPQPLAGEAEKPDDPNQNAESHSGQHAARSPQPGQSGQPAKSLEPAKSRETGEPGNSNDSEQERPSSKPRHAAEPAQADLTVLKTDSSELIAPEHSTLANQVEQPGQTN